MKHAICVVALGIGIGIFSGAENCQAAALTVSPISIQVVVPAQSATVTLQNRDNRPVYAQVRVFRWTQDHGQDRLEPTAAVVPSPPIVQVAGKGAYVLRLQRVSTAPLSGEEAYRVVVDELPDLNRQRNGAVNVLLRYVIPLFFSDADAGRPQLHWTLGAVGPSRVLDAENVGDKHVQIRTLSLKVGQHAVPVAPGLAGYVLGHSTRTWTVPSKQGFTGPARVIAGSEEGPIDAALAP